MSMRFDIITIFPQIFDSYFKESILKRAQKKKLIEIHTHDLRAYTRDKHSKTDDKPYGGGAGMVMMAEPILRAVEVVVRPVIRLGARLSRAKSKIILFSAKGKLFNQKMAHNWSQEYNRIVFISGRYEGIDERAAQILKRTYKKDFEELSIGPYVLTDGDVAAMVVISAIARLIPGVIRTESLQEESHANYQLKTNLEYPHYTRPEVLMWPPPKRGKKGKKYAVPKVLLSGHHQKVSLWRKSKMK